MEVYRVVDQHGFGYKRSLDSEILNWTEKGMSSLVFSDDYFKFRPMPESDGIRSSFIRKYHVFGFENPEQLNRWFLPADQVLGSLLGGEIHIYSVSKSNVIFGSNQLIFDKRKAKLTECLTMSFFLGDDEKACLFDFKEMYLEGINADIAPPPLLSTYFESRQ